MRVFTSFVFFTLLLKSTVDAKSIRGRGLGGSMLVVLKGREACRLQQPDQTVEAEGPLKIEYATDSKWYDSLLDCPSFAALGPLRQNFDCRCLKENSGNLAFAECSGQDDWQFTRHQIRGTGLLEGQCLGVEPDSSKVVLQPCSLSSTKSWSEGEGGKIIFQETKCLTRSITMHDLNGLSVMFCHTSGEQMFTARKECTANPSCESICLTNYPGEGSALFSCIGDCDDLHNQNQFDSSLTPTSFLDGFNLADVDNDVTATGAKLTNHLQTMTTTNDKISSAKEKVLSFLHEVKHIEQDVVEIKENVNVLFEVTEPVTSATTSSLMVLRDFKSVNALAMILAPIPVVGVPAIAINQFCELTLGTLESLIAKLVMLSSFLKEHLIEPLRSLTPVFETLIGWTTSAKFNLDGQLLTILEQFGGYWPVEKVATTSNIWQLFEVGASILRPLGGLVALARDVLHKLRDLIARVLSFIGPIVQLFDTFRVEVIEKGFGSIREVTKLLNKKHSVLVPSTCAREWKTIVYSPCFKECWIEEDFKCSSMCEVSHEIPCGLECHRFSCKIKKCNVIYHEPCFYDCKVKVKSWCTHTCERYVSTQGFEFCQIEDQYSIQDLIDRVTVPDFVRKEVMNAIQPFVTEVSAGLNLDNSIINAAALALFDDGDGLQNEINAIITGFVNEEISNIVPTLRARLSEEVIGVIDNGLEGSEDLSLLHKFVESEMYAQAWQVPVSPSETIPAIVHVGIEKIKKLKEIDGNNQIHMLSSTASISTLLFGIDMGEDYINVSLDGDVCWVIAGDSKDFQDWFHNVNGLWEEKLEISRTSKSAWPGFVKPYNDLKLDVEQLVESICGVDGVAELVYAGFSRGGGIAQVIALAHMITEFKPTLPKSLVTFAAPRALQTTDAQWLQSQLKTSIRLINLRDPVPAVPGPEFGYQHVGANRMPSGFGQDDAPPFSFCALLEYHSFKEYEEFFSGESTVPIVDMQFASPCYRFFQDD